MKLILKHISGFVIVGLFLLGLNEAVLYAENYHRDAFIHWVDDDLDGLDSRQETLAIDSSIPVTVNNGKVTSGHWTCPYTGAVVTDYRKLDIDHIVPLKWAWKHGAEFWSAEKRKQFANDPQNLVAVTASINREKGAQGPDEWLPPRKEVQEKYVEWFILVCQKYGLEFDEKSLKKLLPKR
jgi:hypothetical protein